MATPIKQFGASLVIRSPQATPHTTRVWLNGQEIGRALYSLTLKIGQDDVTRAELTIAVTHVDVDARTLAALTALVAPAPETEVSDAE